MAHLHSINNVNYMFRKLGINIFPKKTEDKKLQRHGQIYIFFLEIFIVELLEILVE